MSINVGHAIARLERAERLAEAELNAQWVIRRSKLKRIPSLNESKERSFKGDSQTCFHGNSYTMKCKQCRRSESEAKINLEALKLKISKL